MDTDVPVLLAIAEAWLRGQDRNGSPPPNDAVRDVLTRLAGSAPDAASLCPAVTRLCGTAYAQVSANIGTRFDASGTSAAPSKVSVKTAADLIGITERAVRKAAAAGHLTATKHPATGEWHIDRASVEAYRNGTVRHTQGRNAGVSDGCPADEQRPDGQRRPGLHAS